MKRRMRKSKLMAEINITPFTDVVLVLLIIFMIATPFIYQSSMRVQLPQASKSEETSRDIIITINAQGDIFLEDAKVDLDTLKYKTYGSDEEETRMPPSLSTEIRMSDTIL